MRIAYRLLLAVLLMAGYLSAHASGYIKKTEVSMEPSDVGYPAEKSYILFIFTCRDANTGQYLSCPIAQEIVGLVDPVTDAANNGGHTHNYPDHPVGRARIVPDPTWSRTVTGSTNNLMAIVNYELPDVSGKIKISSSMGAPPGWYCVTGCYDATSWRYETTVDVGVDGLEFLPPSADGAYVMVRNPDTKHTDANAFFGQLGTNGRLAEIATRYLAKAKRALSVNDMSLPRGGLFDRFGDWSPPHHKHRLGTSADINQGGIACLDDDKLQDSVDWLAPISVNQNVNGRTVSSLLCESGGRKHIDFTLPSQ